MKPYGMRFDGHQYVLNDGGKRCHPRIHLELKRVERRAAREAANDGRLGCCGCGTGAHDAGPNDIVCDCEYHEEQRDLDHYLDNVSDDGPDLIAERTG